MSLKNPKAKGSRNERKTVKYFRKAYDLPFVSRVAGSFGPFDVVGVADSGHVWLVQVKTWPIKKHLKVPNKVFQLCNNPNVSMWVYAWKDWDKEPIIYKMVPTNAEASKDTTYMRLEEV